MNQTEQQLKVKDTSYLLSFIIAFCLLPLVFFGGMIVLKGNYLHSFFVTLLIYLILGIYLVKKMIKNEGIYAIVADSKSVTLQTHGTFRWTEIQTIETSLKREFGRRSPSKYLSFVLRDGRQIILKANNYDTEYTDLKKQLLKLKSG